MCLKGIPDLSVLVTLIYLIPTTCQFSPWSYNSILERFGEVSVCNCCVALPGSPGQLRAAHYAYSQHEQLSTAALSLCLASLALVSVKTQTKHCHSLSLLCWPELPYKHHPYPYLSVSYSEISAPPRPVGVLKATKPGRSLELSWSANLTSQS